VEEYIGKVWGKYVTKKATKLHENAKVTFTDISKSLHLFYHLMGGQKGKDLQVTDKRIIKTSSKSLLEKIAFLGDEFFLAWQDEKSLYLPPSISYFPTQKQNEMLYFWLVAMLSKVDITKENLNDENIKATNELITKYNGFNLFYKEASEYLSFNFPQLSFIKSLENKDLINDYPCPLWIYPSVSSKTYKNEDDEENLKRNAQKDTPESLDMKKHANQIDDEKQTDGFMAFLPESMLNIMEQINVDRAEDDRFDENAIYHAEDLDEITLGKKSANLNARIKMDLDLKPDMSEIYPLGKGHFIDEWDYRKKTYLKNYVRIKPQITLHVEPVSLPKRLKPLVKKIQSELDLLEIERIKNSNLPYGDEINFDAWIEFKTHTNKSSNTHRFKTHTNKSSNTHRFFESFEKKTRDMATLILADVSLSTEAGITQDVRIIDVIKDGLMVFSEALTRLQDRFASSYQTSRQICHIYFFIT